LALATLPGVTCGQDKKVYPPGVTPEISDAIERGLEYLQRSQARDGCWRGNGQDGIYPCTMTALAGMALLSSGATPTRGKYWRSLVKATEFLMRQSQSQGVISAPAEEGRSMYGHGFGMLFLASVYGMEEDQKRQQQLHSILTKAVALTARSQSGPGGWTYAPDMGGDEGSVTITQMQALRAARQAGITVPVETVNKAVAYIRKSANADGGIRYMAGAGGESRPPITAAAVAVLYNAGKYDDPMAEKALQFAIKHLPVSGSNNGHHYYSHLYLSQALYQRGGKQWEEYYPKMAKWLLGQQRKDGSWEGEAGTTYATSIALTILQLPYAYVPIYQR
jgi:hypothetical protein